MFRFQAPGLNMWPFLVGSGVFVEMCFPVAPNGRILDSLGKGIEKHPEAFNDNFNLHLFLERYASNDATDGNPFLHSRTFEAENHEWQC